VGNDLKMLHREEEEEEKKPITVNCLYLRLDSGDCEKSKVISRLLHKRECNDLHEISHSSVECKRTRQFFSHHIINFQKYILKRNYITSSRCGYEYLKLKAAIYHRKTRYCDKLSLRVKCSHKNFNESFLLCVYGIKNVF
jgi:hypothetical protein